MSNVSMIDGHIDRYKEVTSKEIIDGFCYCLNNSVCDDCVLKGEICDASLQNKIKTLKMVAEVLNQQQAEIKWWKDNCSKCGEKTTQTILYLQETLAEKDAEIERLTINMNAFGLGMKQEKERADTIKSEAIKEFAERLKDKASFIGLDGREKLDLVDTKIIDNLVKEMAGDDK